jgi:hypothetical protein
MAGSFPAPFDADAAAGAVVTRRATPGANDSEGERGWDIYVNPRGGDYNEL